MPPGNVLLTPFYVFFLIINHNAPFDSIQCIFDGSYRLNMLNNHDNYDNTKISSRIGKDVQRIDFKKMSTLPQSSSGYLGCSLSRASILHVKDICIEFNKYRTLHSYFDIFILLFSIHILECT